MNYRSIQNCGYRLHIAIKGLPFFKYWSKNGQVRLYFNGERSGTTFHIDLTSGKPVLKFYDETYWVTQGLPTKDEFDEIISETVKPPILDKSYNVGIDEAGVGAIAGPITAAAVLLDPLNPIFGIDDSKNLCEESREHLAKEIHQKAKLCIVVTRTADEVSQQGVHEVHKEVLLECAKMSYRIFPDVDILIDGKQQYSSVRLVFPWPNQIHLGNDSIDETVAAASIIAKVYRDNIMKDFDLQYPQYNFKKHKGYGTPEHFRRIQNYGLSPIHRVRNE